MISGAPQGSDDGSDVGSQLSRQGEAILWRRTDHVSAAGCPQSTYLANTGQHVDGGPEVSNVKYRKRKLDVSVVPNTFRSFLATGQTFAALLIWPL